MLTSNVAAGLVLNVCVMLFVVPLVKAKFDTVAAGPSARLVQGPKLKGSYCSRNPVFICDQSMGPPTAIEVDKLVELAGSAKNGISNSISGWNATGVAVGTESSPE